jgi:predicted lipid-binding transport protein (Tim44 family)
MEGFVDIYTIIFLGLAVVIFLRLRNVLGRRTGSERPPRFDQFSTRRTTTEAPPAAGEKVIALPRRPGRPVEVPSAGPSEVEERIRVLAPAGSPLAIGLQTISATDPNFDPDGFLTGAKKAYEMIVGAFAEGDRKTLRSLLSREVFEGFDGAIAEREARGEKVEHSFVGINKAEMLDAGVKGGSEQITVRFVSNLISATKNKDGAVVDGDPTHVAEVTDVWTFAREVSSRDPNWRLVATESVE